MATAETGMVPKRRFGKTDLQVSIIGMGGFHLASANSEDDAKKSCSTPSMQASTSSMMPGNITISKAKNGWATR